MQTLPKVNYELLEELDTLPFLTPEQKLIAAIIRRAIYDARDGFQELKADKYLKHMRLEAIQWLHSNKLRKWSFIWCCEQLQLDHVYLLKRIKKVKYQIC